MKRLALLAALLAPQITWAACSTTNTMGGTWQLFTGDSTSTMECWITLAGNGTVNSGTCRARSNGTYLDLAVSGGRIAVTATCTAAGALAISNASIVIESARLDPSRNILLGVGRDSFGTYGSVQMVRY